MESSASEARVVHDCKTSKSEDLEDRKYLLVSNTSSSDEELQRELGLEKFRLEEMEAELLLKYRAALDRGIETKERGQQM